MAEYKTTGAYFAAVARTQLSSQFVFGSEATPTKPNPATFDSSELVQWCCSQVDIPCVSGVQPQYLMCKRSGTTLSLDDARITVGALVFQILPGTNRYDHVAISLGDGQVIESDGRANGVALSSFEYRQWTHAGTIPLVSCFAGSDDAVFGDVVLEVSEDSSILNSDEFIAAAAKSVLARGSSGSHVRLLQLRLQQLGYMADVDGKYDSATRAMVQQFQINRRVKSDGVVGEVTWGQLFIGS
jgi:cell wall-associated NlpC family hydrolase